MDCNEHSAHAETASENGKYFVFTEQSYYPTDMAFITSFCKDILIETL